MSKRERRKARKHVRKMKSDSGDLSDKIAKAMIESLQFANNNVDLVRDQDAKRDENLKQAGAD